MRVVTPQEIEVADLTSSVPVDDAPLWAAGPYNLGDQVVYGISVFRAAVNTSQEPGTGSDWVRMGYVNRWRMFRDGRDSKTRRNEIIDCSIETSQIYSTAALLGLVGVEARVIVDDVGGEGVVYDETKSLVDIGVEDFWEWHFLPYDFVEEAVFDGIPPYSGAKLTVQVVAASETDEAACGRVVFGIGRDLGVTNYGTSIELQDYSIKTRDEFGGLTLVPRRAINIINYDVTVPTPRVNFVVRQMRGLAGMAALYIGDEQFGATVTYGVYRTTIQGVDYPSISELTIQVEEF